MHEKARESDWKKLRSMVPGLRDRYLEKLNRELITTLENEELSPTERFWEVEEKVKKEARVLKSCLDGHTRSKLAMFMILMHRHKMLDDEDLMAFSEELREQVREVGAF